jgi:hypothetical protein
VNILGENIIGEERGYLQSWRIPARHIGYDIGRKGIQDEDIIPFLQQFRRVTFFTRDIDFYERTLCHANYCLVYMPIEPDEVANFVRRFLRHREFNTQAKRMGCIIRAGKSGLTVWRINAEKEISFPWD